MAQRERTSPGVWLGFCPGGAGAPPTRVKPPSDLETQAPMGTLCASSTSTEPAGSRPRWFGEEFPKVWVGVCVSLFLSFSLSLSLPLSISRYVSEQSPYSTRRQGSSIAPQCLHVPPTICVCVCVCVCDTHTHTHSLLPVSCELVMVAELTQPE